ncbi:hypothetical protein [Dactylosporangium sp. CA-092794]|uniref:hypothetical protein n=1 Tax=Dactylosporangium sp. CA-092794 TaxID=3239929 RepID=UPI003D942267
MIAERKRGSDYVSYLERGLGATLSASGSNWNWAGVPHCTGDGYYCGGGGAAAAVAGVGGVGGVGGGGSSYGPAGTTCAVAADEDPSVTITYRTAFRLAAGAAIDAQPYNGGAGQYCVTC